MEGLRIKSIEQLLNGIAVPAGQTLTVTVGDTVRVAAAIDYRGPALSDTFYGAIGNRIWFFDEIWKGDVPISFDQSTDWEPYLLTVDIPITEIGLLPWTPGFFDLYVKLNGHPGAGMPEVSNKIEVVLAAEFRNFTIDSYEKV